jgi:hypothetical protein
MQLKVVLVPLFCEIHVSPPFVVFSIFPASPEIKPILSFTISIPVRAKLVLLLRPTQFIPPFVVLRITPLPPQVNPVFSFMNDIRQKINLCIGCHGQPVGAAVRCLDDRFRQSRPHIRYSHSQNLFRKANSPSAQAAARTRWTGCVHM